MIIDGLQCSKFDRELLEELRAGSVDCVTPTLGFWEDAVETMDAIGRWRDLERDNSDLMLLANSAKDIHRAHETNRTAILLGCQNTSCLEDRVRYVELFWDMGMRVLQLTYNTQNSLGSSCYEPHDGGLSRLGVEMVNEMNAVGMLIDLSHVGDRTCLDVIDRSDRPVAITHAVPAALYDHPRSKSSEVLKALADKGGMLGLPVYPNLVGPYAASAEEWAGMATQCAEIVGVERLGIGTDLGRKTGVDHTNWVRYGRWARSVQYGAGSAGNPERPSSPSWFASSANFPDIANALSERGWSENHIDMFMGDNWIEFYRAAFG